MVLARRRWFLAAFLASACPRAGAGSDLRLGDAPYGYAVLDQDLRVALREFGAHMGLRITVSDSVAGRIRGRLPPLPPREFLDRLAAQFGFDWYFDGYALHVTATSEATTAILGLPGGSFDALLSSLKALGVFDARYPLRPHPEPGHFLVSGPPRYVDLVEKTASVQERRNGAAPSPPPAEARESPRPATLTVYRGKDVHRTVIDPAGRPER